jgi:hypothetical protein
MGWRDLVELEANEILAPWLGGRDLRWGPRRWSIVGLLPPEHGWHPFFLRGRSAAFATGLVGAIGELPSQVFRRGVPIGDRFVDARFSDTRFAPTDEGSLLDTCEVIHLLEPGIERFQAVLAGRAYEGGPLIFQSLAMPDPCQGEVLQAWEDGRRSLNGVRAVTPALDLAFRLLWQQRDETERLRVLAERAEQQRQLELAGGTAVGRRAMAVVNFQAAARLALAAGSAEYLDHLPGARPHEMVVRFRTMERRFECVVDSRTLACIDAGICLREDGRTWDTELSLESLPSVVREAINTGRLHVYRHV